MFMELFFLSHIQVLPYSLIVGIQQLFSNLIHYPKYFSIHVEILFAKTLRSQNTTFNGTSQYLPQGTFFCLFSFYAFTIPFLLLVCICVLAVISVGSNSMWSCGLQPTRLLSLWDSPGKNIGVGCHAHLQEILPIQGSNPCLLCLLHQQQEVFIYFILFYFILPWVPPVKPPLSA